MFGCIVGKICFKPVFYIVCFKFSFMMGQGDDLMSCELHGSRLVNVNMSRVGAQYALVGLQHAVDDRGVGLCATGEEPDLRLGDFTSLTDQCPCMFAEAVVAVALRALGVGFHEMAQHSFVCPVVVIAFKMDHVFSFSV